jgi:PhnB protein
MFYGDRSGGIEDPSGHKWYIATHIQDLSLAQVRKRAAELFGKK